MDPQVVRYSERPELWKSISDLSEEVAGLATVHIDRDHDTGEYWEPNVWLIHQTDRGGPAA